MLIQFKNVTVIRDERSVLHELACDLSEHRIGILGSNGSGKSTLLRLINGLTLAGTGQVILDGLEVSRHLSEIRRKVGFIFHNPDISLFYRLLVKILIWGSGD